MATLDPVTGEVARKTRVTGSTCKTTASRREGMLFDFITVLFYSRSIQVSEHSSNPRFAASMPRHDSPEFASGQRNVDLEMLSSMSSLSMVAPKFTLVPMGESTCEGC